ncbi:MAG: molybdopterin-dependent oxidoreductase [Verrucomicrobia bacterium]|nr:molybdopterin-dependent oxidoreductase [Verrucomicrobiota bacterium]
MAETDPNQPAVPLLNVQIDGEWYQFPKGTRMIEACKQVGREVPHYCYHPKLTSPGNCRMCLVEMGMPPRPKPGEEAPVDAQGKPVIQWMPRPVIACANTVSDNMGIRTNSKLTQLCREGVMEFLLINHPLDCPICDQAGECRLQEFSVEHGSGVSRFREEKVKKPKNVDIGPRIRLDDERCIMCSRCIRFCEEIVDDRVLGFTERGSHTTLAVHPGKRLENNYSLNTADICPVGALTSNDFRFQMRVWFLKETPSINVDCGTGVNVTIHSREGKIHRVTPRENNEVNSCWMPDSHRLSFHAIESPDRLTDPLVRSGAGHRQVRWKEAFAFIAESLAKLDPMGVAIVASARMTNEELYLAKRLADLMRVSSLEVVPREGAGDGYLIAADRNPNTNGAKLIFGMKTPGLELPAIRAAVESGAIRGLLVFGEDLTEVPGWSEETLKRLTLLVSVGTHANRTADNAHVVLPAASWAEKRGSMINVAGRLQRLNAAVPIPGQARDDWEILQDLIQGAGGAGGVQGIDDVFRAMAGAVPAFSGLSLQKIGSQGIPLLETGVKIPLLERERERRAKGMING